MIKTCLGLIFVWAGAIKLGDPKTFAEILSAYELVPESLLIPMAIGLPGLEVIAGLGLIFDVKGSLGFIFGLLITFIIVLWFGILKDLEIDCGCFSTGDLKEQDSLRSALYRDMVMIVGVFYLFWHRTVRPVSRRTYAPKMIWLSITKGEKNENV